MSNSDVGSAPVANRYLLLEKLGKGGMGTVYRVRDRLTGQTVALKRVTVAGEQVQFASRASTGDSTDFRIALAREFGTLASLRHPNIISVLDYGFDEVRQPYFTMELLENAQTLVTWGRARPVAAQLELLIQTLQSLAYLHRRGIIHRDLKPDNALVVNEQVKVLDFGLAVARESQQENDTAGTLAYMAPEVLQGMPASERSDLYAVGVMAYELFAGRHPFNVKQPGALIQEILNTIPDVWSLPVDEHLKETLEKLLSKVPEDRPASARDLIAAYAEATGQQAQYETATIRESYLQAAQFTGRETELGQLTSALTQTIAGRGSAWLVGGESGAGKSRLLDELRTVALVNGAQVLRGQAIAEGGSPYLLWHDALRRLCLQTPVSELEASVLKALIPDISTLLDRPVTDAAQLDPQAAQSRLLTVIENMFRGQTQRVVLLLEDLQWAIESLTVLTQLNRVVAELPLLIVATFRDDERPDLPDELAQMQLLKLTRLNPTAIEDLSAAMLGANGRSPQVVDFLTRETEGNVFFMVEVIRVLAEEAGQLDQVGATTLPHKIIAGGMQAVIKRRLSRVPASSRPLLQFAAIAGRNLDLALMQAAFPHSNLNDWLNSVTTIIEVQENRYRFAHDKLREVLLMTLSDEHRRALHRRVAEAIEQCYPNDPVQAPLLAGHWGIAGDIRKEGHYAGLAGEQAAATGANLEAIRLLNRANELAPQAGTSKAHVARLRFLLGRVYSRSGAIDIAIRHLASALNLGGIRYPAGQTQILVRLLASILQQAGHRLRYDIFRRLLLENSEPALLGTLAQTCELLGQLMYTSNQPFASLYFSLLSLNLAEQAGPEYRDLQARSHATLMIATRSIPLHSVAGYYKNLAAQAIASVDEPDSVAWTELCFGMYEMGKAVWSQGHNHLTRCSQLAHQIGNLRRWSEPQTMMTAGFILQGKWHEAKHLALEYYTKNLPSADKQIQAAGLLSTGYILCYEGDTEKAGKLFADSLLIQPADDRSNLINILGGLAQTAMRSQQTIQAKHWLRRFLLTTGVETPTAWWLATGYWGAAETALSLLETEGSDEHRQLARQALRCLGNYARSYICGQPFALIHQSWRASLDRKASKAQQLARQAIDSARAKTMPQAEALAYYHLGRFLPASDTRRTDYLNQAAAIFEQLGATWDLAQTKMTLQHPP